MDLCRFLSLVFGLLLVDSRLLVSSAKIATKRSALSTCLSAGTLDKSRTLAEKFQSVGVLSREDFDKLFSLIQDSFQTYHLRDVKRACRPQENGTASGLDSTPVQDVCSENITECSTLDEIFSHHSGENGLEYTQLPAALQEAIYTVTNHNCFKEVKLLRPTIGEAWGYGIAFVATLVFLVSNIGALLTPLMSKNFFQRILQFFVAMGSGTLAATGLLVLIPESFDVASCKHISENYIWKSTTALFSIYVFFMSERLINFFLKSKEARKFRRDPSFEVSTPNGNEKETMSLNFLENGNDHGHSHFLTPAQQGQGQQKASISTVAWIVMIGDIIHKFVDGMAIGAAFTEDIYLGISIGIAVLSEELPHEMSDIAILLHSGMSMKKAIFVNFLSGSVAFIGLITGILVGENTGASRWILAIAGGLFLYVPLVDMLPDMSHQLEMKMKESHMKGGKVVSREVGLLLLIQGIGFIIGICIIIVVIYFSGQIQIS